MCGRSCKKISRTSGAYDLLKRRRTWPPYLHKTLHTRKATTYSNVGERSHPTRTQARSRQAACRRCLATQQPGPEGPLKPGLASWFGHRTWLHGLDALPGATALGRRCPAAPSCARAKGYFVRAAGGLPHRHQHHPEGWGLAALRTPLPDRGRGRGAVAPPSVGNAAGAALGRWPRTSSAPP